MRWTCISTPQTETSLGACKTCLCWLLGLSGSLETNSTPADQPQKKPAGQMYSASGAVRSTVVDQHIGDDAVTRHQNLVGRSRAGTAALDLADSCTSSPITINWEHGRLRETSTVASEAKHLPLVFGFDRPWKNHQNEFLLLRHHSRLASSSWIWGIASLLNPTTSIKLPWCRFWGLSCILIQHLGPLLSRVSILSFCAFFYLSYN